MKEKLFKRILTGLLTVLLLLQPLSTVWAVGKEGKVSEETMYRTKSLILDSPENDGRRWVEPSEEEPKRGAPHEAEPFVPREEEDLPLNPSPLPKIEEEQPQRKFPPSSPSLPEGGFRPWEGEGPVVEEPLSPPREAAEYRPLEPAKIYGDLSVSLQGDLPLERPALLTLRSQEGEVQQQEVRDSLVTFDKILHGVYVLELTYENQNNEPVAISKTLDLTDTAQVHFQETLATNLLQWKEGEIYVTPNYSEVDLSAEDHEGRKILWQTQIQGDDLVFSSEWADPKSREPFTMRLYDGKKEQTLELVAEPSFEKDLKREPLRALYRLDLNKVVARELDVEFLEGEEKSETLKVFLDNRVMAEQGRDIVKKSLETLDGTLPFSPLPHEEERGEQEEGQRPLGPVMTPLDRMIRDNENIPYPMRTANALSTTNLSRANQKWEITSPAGTVNGKNMSITSLSLQEEKGSLQWTAVIHQTKKKLFHKHHFHVSQVDGGEILRVQSLRVYNSSNEEVAMKDIQAGMNNTYYTESKGSPDTGTYTYIFTTNVPQGDRAALKFKVYAARGINDSSALVDTEIVANRATPPPEEGTLHVDLTFHGERPSSGKVILKQQREEKFSQGIGSQERLTFENIPVGDYRVSLEDLPVGYEYTPSPQNITVTKEGTQTHFDITAPQSPTPTTQQHFHFEVHEKDHEDQWIPGVALRLTDDGGKVVTGQTDSQGKATLEGTFTAGTYSLKITAVPQGYKLPTEEISVTYQPSNTEDHSTPVRVELEPVEGARIELHSNGKPITDATITLKIWEDTTQATSSQEVTLRPGEQIPFPMEDGKTYHIQVLESDPSIYETGGTTTISYDAQEPHIIVNIPKKTDVNTLEVRFHEGSLTGDYTDKLQGQTLRLKRGDKTLEAPIQGGVAIFMNPEQGEYTLLDPAPSVPGYRLVSNSPFTLSKPSGYQDWVLVRDGATVHLSAKAPAGKAFPEEMTVTLINATTKKKIQGPVPIGNGQLSFEHVPQGETYQFLYDKVPPYWTHGNAMATPFVLPKDAEMTTVADQFGYDEPLANQSQISVKVVDNAHQPMAGFVFDVKDKEGRVVATVETQENGVGKTQVNTLDPGTYTVENRVAPPGYLKVNFSPFTLTAEKPNIHIDAMTGRDGTENQSHVYIHLKDMEGHPISGENLIFYEDSKPLTNELQTDVHGDTYIAPLNVKEGARYRITLGPNSHYELIQEPGVTEDILIEKNTSKQLNLTAKIKEDFGKIIVKAHTKEDEPAPNLKVTIKKDGTAIAHGPTGLDGNYLTKFLENGSYEVTVEESRVYQLAEGESATKTVEITKDNQTPTVEFLVEKKAFEAGNAGSITVAGNLIGEEGEAVKTSWVVTVDKFNSKPTKSGVVNTLKIPAHEMIQPTVPVLMRKVGDGPYEQVPVKGKWVRVGDNYQLVDKRNGPEDKTEEEVIYQYSFVAIGVDSATQYSTTATTKIHYNDGTLIDPVSATYTLEKGESEPMADLQGTGSGTTDQISRTVEWNYDGKVEVRVPGELEFILKRPQDSGLKKPRREVQPVVTIKNPDGTTNDQVQYSVVFDEKEEAYKVVFDTQLLTPFDFHVTYVMDIEEDQSVDEYRLDTKYIYQGIGMDQPKDYVPLTLTAMRILNLPGKQVDQISTCENGRHRVNLYGEMAEDGKSIHWTARVANLDKDGTKPFTMDIVVGEGLGDASILGLNSVGRSFPFITKADTLEDYVYDEQGDHNATKKFRVHADATHHYIGKNYKNSYLGTYRYITTFRKPDPALGIQWIGPRNHKKDLRGETHYLDWNSAGVASSDDKSQALKLGDYVEVSFDTPITDFSRMSKKDASGQYLGYGIDVIAKAFDPKDLENTHGAVPVCDTETSLVLREDPYNAGEVEEGLYKNKKGEVLARGKYIDNGEAIEWEIEVTPLRSGITNLEKRDLKVRYALVDSNNEFLPDNTGLSPIEGRNPLKIEGEGFQLTESQEQYQGELIAEKMNLNEKLIYTFVTPVKEDKAEYRLKVEGYYGDKGWQPLKDSGGSHVAYVVLKGKSVAITVDKKWENVYNDVEKPNFTLRLEQLSIDGTRRDLLQKEVHTPKNKQYISTSLTEYEENGELKKIPRFDENGYRYQYILREDPLEGYKSSVVKLDSGGKLWSVVNTKDDFVAKTKNPVVYGHEQDGVYPKEYRQDGPDIRNAKTEGLNTAAEPYKVEYEDAIVGKSGQQTEIPGMFDMKLTIEGKSKHKSSARDIIFVLDNSSSMNCDWNGEHMYPHAQEEKTKLYNMTQIVEDAMEELMKDNTPENPHTRIGIVNFATTNRRKDPNKNHAGYQHYAANGGQLQPARFNKYDESALTIDLQRLKETLPKAVRWNGTGDASDNTGNKNLGEKYPGMTNIAGGVAEAGSMLLANETERKKVMVILSDGAPTASLKLKNYPLDPNLTLEENLADTDGQGFAKYLISNNRYYLQKLKYSAYNGQTNTYEEIDNNGTAAIAISRYYQERDPNMEIYSIAMNKKGTGFVEVMGQNGDDPPESAEVVMERVLRGVTSNSQTNYYTADNSAELKDRLKKIAHSIKSDSIVNGEVTDPMGDMVILKEEGTFSPASDLQFTDGDYYLSDNQGHHMDQSGNILGSGGKNLLEGVTVVKEGQGFKIRGLNLGKGEEVTLHYRIHLNTEDPSFIPQHYYQANKETTLTPQPDKSTNVRHFPIPSVKGANLPLSMTKYWFIKMVEYKNGLEPVDLNHWVYIGRTWVQPHDEKNQETYREKLQDLGAKPIVAKVYRYRGKIDDQGRIARADPDEKGKLIREVTISDANNWKATALLPAYDSKGGFYIYEVEESTALGGFSTTYEVTLPKAQYNIKDGYYLGEYPNCDEEIKYKIKNTQEDRPQGFFEIRKVDSQDPEVFLQDAIFELRSDSLGFKKQSTTGEDGMASFDDLEKGTYILEEIEAPPGYQRSNRQYKVQVGPQLVEDTKNYVITITYEEDGEIKTLTSMDTNSFVYQIENVSLELPYTGFTPTMPTTLLIVAAGILAMVAYVYHVNRREGEEDQ